MMQAMSAAGELGVKIDGLQAELRKLGDVRVVVGDVGAEVAKQTDDLERRRLAQVADAALVGDAEQQHTRAPHRLRRRR